MDRILAISLFRNASTNGQTCWRDEAGLVTIEEAELKRNSLQRAEAVLALTMKKWM